MRRTVRIIPTSIALAALFCVGVSAQSVSDIVEDMYDAYERQAEGVDNYTLVQSVMGFESTSYFVKEMVDGHPVFRMAESATSGDGFNFSLGGEDTGAGDVYVFGPELIEHGRYDGREQIDGRGVHVIAIDDLSQLALAQQPTPDDMDFVPRNGRLFVDAEMLVPAIDPHAYITGHYALHVHNLVTQVPTTVTCFTDRRSPRARERDTPVGRLVFVCVCSGVYAPQPQGALAPPTQALCDYVYLSRRQGVRPEALVTFRDLRRIRTPDFADRLARYPVTVQKHIERLLDGR